MTKNIIASIAISAIFLTGCLSKAPEAPTAAVTAAPAASVASVTETAPAAPVPETLDSRNLEISNQLFYRKNADTPFTGKLRNVRLADMPFANAANRLGAVFMTRDGNGPMLNTENMLCDIDVNDGRDTKKIYNCWDMDDPKNGTFTATRNAEGLYDVTGTFDSGATLKATFNGNSVVGTITAHEGGKLIGKSEYSRFGEAIKTWTVYEGEIVFN